MYHARSRCRSPVLAVVLAALGVALLAGCSKSSEAAPVATSVAEPAGRVETSSVDNANYTAKIALAAPCKKGEVCNVQITLQAKGEYHINDKYPYKFKPQDPPAAGIKYPKAVVGREDGTFEEKRAVLTVPFIAEASGQSAVVGGTLSLSVCSSANCLMDKQTLELSAKVD